MAVATLEAACASRRQIGGHGRGCKRVGVEEPQQEDTTCIGGLLHRKAICEGLGGNDLEGVAA